MANPTHQTINTNNKDRISDMNPDKKKNPDKSREVNKENPDSTEKKGSDCGC